MRKSAPYFIPVVTVILALLTMLSPLAIDTFLSAMPTIATFFGVQMKVVELSITLYLLGFAFGQLIGGPVSDAFGRKLMATLGLILYSIGSFGIASANSMSMFLVFRVLQAVGGGFASVTNMAFVRDWFEGKQVAKLSSLISMIMMLAPLFAPILGTYLFKTFGWESIFYSLFGISLVVLLIVVFVLPESRPQHLITRKVTIKQFVGNYKIILSNRPALLVVLTLGFAISGMFTFITSAASIYINHFNQPVELFPVLFGANVALNIVLSLANTQLLRRFEPEQMLGWGLTIQILAACVLLLAPLLHFDSLVVIFGCNVLYVGSLGLVFGNGVALVLNMFPQLGGAANAVIGVVRFTISGLIGLAYSLLPSQGLKPYGIIMWSASFIAVVCFGYYRKTQKKRGALI